MLKYFFTNAQFQITNLFFIVILGFYFLQNSLHINKNEINKKKGL